MRKVSGFTLIELIAVIAILGVLAAVAVPKLFDTTAAARTAAANGFKASIEAGSALNYATKISCGTGSVAVFSCTPAALGALVNGGLPATVSVYGAGTTVPGATLSCTLEYTASGVASTVGVNVIASSA